MTTASSGLARVAHSGCVASIGVFDGVHRGHQSLLALARLRADALGLPLVTVTFDPHPMSVVGPRRAPTSLATLSHRVALLRSAGADEVDVRTFDETFAAMDAEAFIAHVLVTGLNVKEIVVGQDFRFGHGAAGTFDTLVAEGDRRGFRATAAPLVGGGAVRWSSTHARTLICDGDVAGAAEVLGRPYRLDGVVVHGDHRGRDLGYPTANLRWSAADPGPTVPADGVYAGRLLVAGEELPAAVSVGMNPQFEGHERRVEAYVLDHDGLDLYDLEVGVSFVERIRGQQTFDSVPDLVARMALDVDEARECLTAAD